MQQLREPMPHRYSWPRRLTAPAIRRGGAFGRAPAGSLAAGFLAYLDETVSQKTIRDKGHLPCLREPEQCR